MECSLPSLVARNDEKETFLSQLKYETTIKNLYGYAD